MEQAASKYTKEQQTDLLSTDVLIQRRTCYFFKASGLYTAEIGTGLGQYSAVHPLHTQRHAFSYFIFSPRFLCVFCLSVHLGERTYAASLAEKYHDFGVLIELCESSGDQDTLQRYMNQFTQQVGTRIDLDSLQTPGFAVSSGPNPAQFTFAGIIVPSLVHNCTIIVPSRLA